MSIGRTAEIYLNAAQWGGSFPLLNADGSTARIPEFIACDVFELSLRWLSLPSAIRGAPTVEALPGSWAIVFAIKAARDDSDILASASSFSLVTGDGDTRYTATLSLDTDPAIPVGTTPLNVWCDVEVSNAGNTERLTWQFQAVINPQTYNGESSPTPAEPAYPAPGAIPVRCVGSVAIPAGSSAVACLLDSSRDVIPVCTVRKPSAEADDIFVLSTYGLSAAGFTCTLSSPTPSGGYYLDYIGF